LEAGDWIMNIVKLDYAWEKAAVEKEMILQRMEG
jgi:hypothetical protein